jgi:hypothetical protein
LTRGRLAEVFNGRVIADLIHEYRWHIRFFAAVFMGSVFAAIAAYKLLGAAPNDWRPAAWVSVAESSRRWPSSI